ncbi:MAG: translation elongation factor-like protein [Chloroflexi bacterium]|nr:translation elongation factor-like protein [Chloroflexota bacterium]
MPEEKIGRVVDYYAHLGVAGIDLLDGGIKVGDTIHIQGHTTDLLQVVDSLEVDRLPVKEAARGESVGIRVKDRVRRQDTVYKVIA